MTTALLERDDLLAALAACARSAAAGQGGTVLVSGEAGIGKTSLLERFAADNARGRVLWGGCESLATPRPLGPLQDVAAQAGSALRALLSRPHDSGVLFGAVLDELARPPAPTLLVFEDVHWADEATLDLIKFVGRRIHHLPALLVLSHRDDIASITTLRPPLGQLPAAHLTRIVVPALTPRAVDALAAAAARNDGAGVFAATGGNPFFVTEVLAQVDAPAGAPSTVRDAVLGRAAQLGAAAMQVLQLVAIVPRQAELQLVADVLAPATEDVEACLASGLLVADGHALRFRHELARTAVEQALLAPRALQLHGRVLGALAARSHDKASLARLVHHARLAGDVDAVLRWAPLAAREAGLRGARKEAAAHGRAALAHAARLDDAARAALLDEQATHSFELNDLDAAIPAREQAIALFARLGDVEREVEALAAQALALVRALRNADADATSRRAIELVERMAPGPHRARAYATESYLRMLNRDIDDAIRWGEQAISIAERFDDRATLAGAHKTVGAALMFIDYERGCEFVLRSLEIARTLGDGGAGVADAYVMLSTASGELHAFDAAERYLVAGIAHARAHDLDRLAGYMESWQALCDTYRGRWQLAGERANAAVAEQTPGTTNRVVALVALGRLRSRRGDPGALGVLDEALALALRSNTLQRLAPVAAARAEAAWLEGRTDDAGQEADRVFDLAVQKRHRWFRGELALWRWRAGRDPGTLDGCAAPFRLQIEGRWREAADEWESLGCPYERARALADGDEPAQRESLALLDRLGAVPLAEQIRRAMRSAGVRSVPRGALATTRSNAAGLTARELQVLELVAAGCRNAEIATRLSRSARTVEHHLESILAKLDVDSRADAVAAARRLGVLAKDG